MNLKIIFLAPVIALAGCGSIASITGINPTVSSRSADVAVNSFDALEVVATGYIQLPACGSAGSPLACRSQVAAASIKKAVLTGRAARTQIENAMLSANGGDIPVVSMSALQGAIATLQALYVQYNIQH